MSEANNTPQSSLGTKIVIALVSLALLGAGIWLGSNFADKKTETAEVYTPPVINLAAEPETADTIEKTLAQEVIDEPTPKPDTALAPQFEPAPQFVESKNENTEPSAAPEVEFIEAPEPEPNTLTLDNSDQSFLDGVQQLAPKLIAWMTPDQQIRKWVTTVDNFADSKVPLQDRPLAFHIGKYKVDQRDEQIYVNPNNQHRANVLINSITQIPPQQLVKLYHEWLPMLQEAYDELGRDDHFNERVVDAIDNILAIEPINQISELKQPAVFYVYADKNLEETDKLTKLFWRLGPDNTKKIQAYLRQVKPLL
ncbi:MAG: DUF3014 domain-containing protein [Venatoribacter sp.]